MGCPAMSLSMVSSNRMAPRIRSPVKLGLRDEPRPHLMHESEHLIVVGPGVVLDPVKDQQRLRRAAATLVQGRDEAGLRSSSSAVVVLSNRGCVITPP